jgi:hypothetical protein
MARESKRSVWAKRIAAFERSGLSRRAWCSARGLSVSSLDAWRYRLRREAASGLLPVVVTESASVAAGAAAVIEVSCGMATIRVPASTDAQWLATLVRGLGQSTC